VELLILKTAKQL